MSNQEIEMSNLNPNVNLPKYEDIYPPRPNSPTTQSISTGLHQRNTTNRHSFGLQVCCILFLVIGSAMIMTGVLGLRSERKAYQNQIISEAHNEAKLIFGRLEICNCMLEEMDYVRIRCGSGNYTWNHMVDNLVTQSETYCYRQVNGEPFVGTKEEFETKYVSDKVKDRHLYDMGFTDPLLRNYANTAIVGFLMFAFVAIISVWNCCRVMFGYNNHSS